MTTPDTLAAAREAVALGEKATPGPWFCKENDRNFIAHAGTHYAAIAAALLAAEAEGERLRGEIQAMKGSNDATV